MKDEDGIFYPVKLHLQPGDIITSKKGILMQDLLGETYLVKKLKIISDRENGKGVVALALEKTPIKVKPLKEIREQYEKRISQEITQER
jgi:hypothetical protein